MKSGKIASIVYYILMVISVVIFVLFFCVGFGREESLPTGLFRSPQFTDLLLYWTYALIFATIILTVVGAVMSIAAGNSIDSNIPKWGKILTSAGLWLFVPSLLISWIAADKSPIMTGTGLYEQTMWLQATDAMMYTIYVLMVVTLIGVVISLTGVFKR